MLEQIYRSKPTIELLRHGPLGDYAEELVQYYLDRGNNVSGLKSRFGPLSQFNKLLVSENKSLKDLNRDLIEKFISYQIKTKRSFISSGAYFLFKQLIKLLVRDGILQPIAKKPEYGSAGINKILSEYRLYLEREKGLAPSSVLRYGNLALDFVVYASADTIPKLKRIDARNIHSYIIEHGKIYSTKHVQVIATGLRCFLMYLLNKGMIKMDLTTCIPTLCSYRASHLPEYLDPQQLEKLLRSCNQHTPIGIRNYAVLLLLSRVGLRASEVIGLTLKDFNWRCGEFTIKGKRGIKSTMPLPNDVGKAISDYIVHFRPNIKSAYLFLNTRAPYQRFNNPSTVSSIVRRQLYIANIETTSKGAHVLRYTVATHCLNNGGSLFEVSELLRHFSINTTAIYAKVDYKRLSQLAMPWPSSQEVPHA